MHKSSTSQVLLSKLMVLLSVLFLPVLEQRTIQSKPNYLQILVKSMVGFISKAVFCIDISSIVTIELLPNCSCTYFSDVVCFTSWSTTLYVQRYFIKVQLQRTYFYVDNSDNRAIRAFKNQIHITFSKKFIRMSLERVVHNYKYALPKSRVVCTPLRGL